jgi:hypothetical protein
MPLAQGAEGQGDTPSGAAHTIVRSFTVTRRILHTRKLLWSVALLTALVVPIACSVKPGEEVQRPTPEKGANGFFACEDPTPYSYKDSGYELCASGFIHRPAINSCVSLLPVDTGNPDVSNPDSEDPYAGCHADVECTDAPHGECTELPGGDIDLVVWGCNYGCVEDTDCGDGRICLCGERIGECVSSKCTSDADCADGALCVGPGRFSCWTNEPFSCQTPSDTCGGSNHCWPHEVCERAGEADPTDGPWTCFEACQE